MLSKYPLFLFSATLFGLIRGIVAAPGNTTGSTGGSSFIAITGVSTGVNGHSGLRPFRRNILDLQYDTPAWSLYIQALTLMQNANESDPMSYFQIAGIHGRPFIPWNNFYQGTGSSYFGYCTHSSVLFPTWHRPYLALFEQIIAGYAQNIASQYPEHLLSTYQDAANSLRIPYWDWASSPRMPDIISNPAVDITTPTGNQTVHNPLMQYKFQTFPLNPNYFSGSAQASMPQTARDPDTLTGPSNVTAVNNNLAGGNLMSRTYSLLSKSLSYDSFATEKLPGISLEAIHDDVHVYIGGNYGQMTYLEYAAFDPIFFLHHTNVDRLFALWQAVSPNAELFPLTESIGTYTLSSTNLDTVLTGLTPFTSNTRGETYNSNTAKTMKTFGYSYPEIEDWHQSISQLKANVSAQINTMYNQNGIFGKFRSRSAPQPGSTSKEWSAGLKVFKHDLGGSHFFVRFFVGNVPSDPQDWAKSAVASVAVMPTPHYGNGPLPSVDLYDEVSLQSAITNAGIDPNDTDYVERYLTDALTWKVQQLNGSTVPIEQLHSLYITVYDEIVTLPSDITQLPTYTNQTVHFGITESKLGGSQQQAEEASF